MKNVLHSGVNIVKCLRTPGFPLMGQRRKIGSQTNGKCSGIVELVSQYDPFLAENLVKYGNLGSGNTSYLSETIYQELIHLMGNKVFSFIVKELKGRKYFSLIVDSTADVSHTDQLTVIQ